MLILASNSPRRKQLLALGGWGFSVLPAHVDERVRPGELPGDYVRRLAESKALAARHLLDAPAPEALVVAADTAVVDVALGPEYEILGKPRHAAEAEAMLRRLRRRAHQVYTGVAVLRAGIGVGSSVFAASRDDVAHSDTCITDVTMRDYSDAEMGAYVASGDPLDKAGAYAIQDTAFRPVESLRGCYANVVGLPLCHLTRLLGGFGVRPGTQIAQQCQDSLGYTCQVYRQVLAGSLEMPA